jgi:hypothetical protein
MRFTRALGRSVQIFPKSAARFGSTADLSLFLGGMPLAHRNRRELAISVVRGLVPETLKLSPYIEIEKS